MKLGAVIVWGLSAFYLVSAITSGYENYAPGVLAGPVSFVAKVNGALPTVIPGVFFGFLLFGVGLYLTPHAPVGETEPPTPS